jgi:hypothetical protein
VSRPLPYWPSEAEAGKPLHPVKVQRPRECRRCGKAFLFWHQHEGRHLLHHYADLDDGRGPRFILHRCGFTSAGVPIAGTPA